ncbi:MAG TPA: type II toxin-antitoxin system ParD family antitoxin [Caulobacteraceae bacterium]|jgi:antitoxin ParD1/3/4
MATRNVSLTAMLDAYVEDRVRSGEFQNASEVVRDALRLHKARVEDEARKIERFNRLVQDGIDDYEAGRYEVVEIDRLDEWLDQLVAEVNAPTDSAAE